MLLWLLSDQPLVK